MDIIPILIDYEVTWFVSVLFSNQNAVVIDLQLNILYNFLVRNIKLFNMSWFITKLTVMAVVKSVHRTVLYH